MASRVISVRLDDTTKAQMDSFCAEVGLSTSTAFKMFAKNVVKNRRLPFDVEADYILTEREILKRYEDLTGNRRCEEHELIEE